MFAFGGVELRLREGGGRFEGRGGGDGEGVKKGQTRADFWEGNDRTGEVGEMDFTTLLGLGCGMSGSGRGMNGDGVIGSEGQSAARLIGGGRIVSGSNASARRGTR